MNVEKTEIKKILFEFNAEANAFLRAEFSDLESALARFLSYIEGKTVIWEYVDDCIVNYLPEGFDAIAEVEAVSSNPGMFFGPFPPNAKSESAEVYLILKALLEYGVGSPYVFYGYSGGSKKFNDWVDRFLERVAKRLVSGISTYLSLLGIEAGLDDNIGQTNIFSKSIEACG